MKITIFATLLLLFSNLVASNDHGSHAISHDPNSFKEALTTERNFVMFYAPWCGHCKNLSPTWDELAKLYNNLEGSPVVISKVDCTVHTALCSEQEIVGFPTLKLFSLDESDPKRYTGRRDLDSLKSYLANQLNEPTPESVMKEEKEVPAAAPETDGSLVMLTDANFDEYVSKGVAFVKFYAPWCGHCKRLAPIWKELADSLKDNSDIMIAKVDCDENPVTCGKHKVRGYPTLVLFNEGEKVKSYESDRSLHSLQAFVTHELELAKIEVEEGEGDVEEDEMIHEPGKVIELTTENFHDFMSDKMAFVKFYAPWCGHCKRLAPTWDDLAKVMEDENVAIAKVDCTMHKSVCDENEVRGYPTLKIFRNGKKLENYSQSRTLDSLVKFVRDTLQKHDEL